MISQQEINIFLVQADPEGLISSGAPSDEYTSEAEAIYKALQHIDGAIFEQKDIVAIIAKVWEHSFHLAESDLLNRHGAFNDLAKLVMER